MPKDHGIGASVKRREDIRFLTGAGHYTDDVTIHGQAYAVFVRSNVAHGKIISVGAEAAKGMPGVLAVFTGEDFKDVGGNPAGWLIKSRNGEAMRSAPCWRMARCAMSVTPMPPSLRKAITRPRRLRRPSRTLR